MIRYVLPIYYEIEYKTKKNKTILVGLNWYRNSHHFLNNEVKHYFHEQVAKQYNGEKFNQIELFYKVYQKRANTDGHNIRSILEKFVLDAFVQCGMIENDTTPKNIKRTATEFFIDKDNPRIEIEITKVV